MHRESETRFGLLRFRSPLLTEYFLVSVPPGTEMLQFPPYTPYSKEHGHPGLQDGVSPFGNFRIKGC